jgi:hypothetical protein
MNPIRVTIRREKDTGQLALFFRNSNGRGNWIECFTRREGHNEVSREYMQRRCTPVDPTDPEAVRLARFWESIGPDRHLVTIARRL